MYVLILDDLDPFVPPARCFLLTVFLRLQLFYFLHHTSTHRKYDAVTPGRTRVYTLKHLHYNADVAGTCVAQLRCVVRWREGLYDSGESINDAVASSKWICPKCRGSCGEGCKTCCNCGPCRKAHGLPPTHQIIHKARAKGFDNVHDFLVHCETGATAVELLDRKKTFNWGKWLTIDFSRARAAAVTTAATAAATAAAAVAKAAEKQKEKVSDRDAKGNAWAAKDDERRSKAAAAERLRQEAATHKEETPRQRADREEAAAAERKRAYHAKYNFDSQEQGASSPPKKPPAADEFKARSRVLQGLG